MLKQIDAYAYDLPDHSPHLTAIYCCIIAAYLLDLLSQCCKASRMSEQFLLIFLVPICTKFSGVVVATGPAYTFDVTSTRTRLKLNYIHTYTQRYIRSNQKRVNPSEDKYCFMFSLGQVYFGYL